MNSEFYNAIEEPVRELVRRLRDSGINTTCSCGHEMYVQVDLVSDGFLHTIHRTVYDWLVESNTEEPEYQIDIHMVVRRGIVSQCFANIHIGGER